MADIKTNLRELSVATVFGLFNRAITFKPEDLYDSKCFMGYAKKVISGDISSASNLEQLPAFRGEYKQIVDNGYRLAKAIYEKDYFQFPRGAEITWQGNDTHKEDPVDVTMGDYGFSLKENSFILDNMGLYQLLNCYTGSRYRSRHIFKDYAAAEYAHWFDVTWKEMRRILNSGSDMWSYTDPAKGKRGKITASPNSIKFEYLPNNGREAMSDLPADCSLEEFESRTSSTTREQVFAKFIRLKLDSNTEYNAAKKACAVAASNALAQELNENLRYDAGLPRFLRIHTNEYYYAKTTPTGITILKVPGKAAFGNDIVIESIEASVPISQANILTTIKNRKTGRTLVLRNECRFSHGQFNGTPEAKMYYEQGGSLEVIYEMI